MEYVRFGSAGVKVSRLALGLGLRGQMDEREAERLILRAYDGGINLFDCANVYGLGDDRAYAGRSEEILGRALKGRRDDVVITSKVVSAVGPGPNDRGGSHYHIMREVDRSLRRLDTDRIDIYLLHSFDATTPLEEQLRTLDDLVRQGKVRYTGVCNYQAWQVCHALWIQQQLNAPPLITIQNRYSLLDRELEREMFPLLRHFGIGMMAYSPLAIGLLSGMYRPGEPPPPGSLWAKFPQEAFERALSGAAGATVSAAHELAARHGATVAQLALKWVLSRPEVTVAISGADTDAQMEENLGAVDLQLPAEDLELLDRVSAGQDAVAERMQRR
ncbi:MAG: aldo/keto reductase [Chloroflexi bacterium]|nr:aldo/keto reductase [Chloroflexota bacterium]